MRVWQLWIWCAVVGVAACSKSLPAADPTQPNTPRLGGALAARPGGGTSTGPTSSRPTTGAGGAAQPGAEVNAVIKAQPAAGAEVPPAAGSTELNHPYHQPLPSFDPSAPAMRIANLSPAECKRELRSRSLAVAPHKYATRGIAYALRVTGPMHGVRYVTGPPSSPYGLLDCRMALVLDQLAEILAPLGVSEVHVGSIYRKGARVSGRRRRSQHSYGLAMDVASLRLRDGRLLRVERDFHATVGDVPCGPAADMTDPNDASVALRNIVCAVVRSGVFHHVLTPCNNRAHRDHLHFDIQRGAKYRRIK